MANMKDMIPKARTLAWYKRDVIMAVLAVSRGGVRTRRELLHAGLFEEMNNRSERWVTAQGFVERARSNDGKTLFFRLTARGIRWMQARGVVVHYTLRAPWRQEDGTVAHPKGKAPERATWRLRRRQRWGPGYTWSRRQKTTRAR